MRCLLSAAFVVDASPPQDFVNARRNDAVALGGRLLDRAELDALLDDLQRGAHGR